jgi:AraC family transcriptional regulator of adaptative response/methylated-DNA-[protein]-cysteine methyltransferase
MSNDQPAFAAETIRFGFRPTGAGLAAIAVSQKGVVAILLGADPHELTRKLAEALPAADLVDDEASIGPALDAVARRIANPAGETDFDLDMRGSADQRAVWAALRAIPTGETRSYGAVAKAIGTGITAQEVGAACAANRLAIVVPCHRVLKADGSISGYRWGVHRKRALLAMEKAA